MRAMRQCSTRVRMERRRLLVRPFSQVLEVDVEADGRTIGAFVKILRPRSDGVQELEATRRNIAREFEVTAKVHGGFAPHAGLSTARPIACYPELLAMVTERVDGVSLQRLLARVPQQLRVEGVADVLGQFLAACHAHEPAGANADRIRGWLLGQLPASLRGCSRPEHSRSERCAAADSTRWCSSTISTSRWRHSRCWRLRSCREVPRSRRLCLMVPWCPFSRRVPPGSV